ncbi:TetR family transcriptional regulator [Nonomuraea sp. K274]|uniref:TetR family transcriptional regulator n=1 Tax=Nonomuraea cypriaca TaxID=1187855 RepID=A0A931EWY7_9ACTN|nr:TetR/AcrR family transcriptional regulator [Nonomuraea cypriaca]MBF8185690.1 TetR family transcriptional regulator [Nonomuraea cypriaca]
MSQTRRRRGDGEFTFTEAARREQIIGLTIDLIAEHGLARTTLARIAEAVGVSNAAVLYFFGSKNAVIQEAVQRVLTGVVDAIAAAIAEASTAREGIDAYVRALVGHMAAHPTHVRVVIEMLTSDIPVASEALTEAGSRQPPRWRPLADLIERAQLDGDLRALDARTTAIALSGAIDAVFAESLTDPDYDLTAAVDTLLDLFDRATSRDPCRQDDRARE